MHPMHAGPATRFSRADILFNPGTSCGSRRRVTGRLHCVCFLARETAMRWLKERPWRQRSPVVGWVGSLQSEPFKTSIALLGCTFVLSLTTASLLRLRVPGKVCCRCEESSTKARIALNSGVQLVGYKTMLVGISLVVCQRQRRTATNEFGGKREKEKGRRIVGESGLGARSH